MHTTRRTALALGLAATLPRPGHAADAPPPASMRVFVTGSSDGLGLAAARQLIAAGHRVVLHGRNAARAEDARRAAPGAEAAVVGDVSLMAECRALAEGVNRIGPCDAVIHNVGISARTGGKEGGAERTGDGLPPIFAVNTLAPFMLTVLVGRPKRLVYLSSSAHRGVRLDPADLTFSRRPYNGWAAYGESKLQDAMLAFAVARRWPGVLSNAMDPGWVPTAMGGAGAPGSVEAGAATEAWLATSPDPAARVTGRFFHDRREQQPDPAARDEAMQDRLVAECERIAGLRLA